MVNFGIYHFGDSSRCVDSARRAPVVKNISESLRTVIRNTIDTTKNPTAPQLTRYLINKGHEPTIVVDTLEDMILSGCFRIYHDFRLFNR